LIPIGRPGETFGGGAAVLDDARWQRVVDLALESAVVDFVQP
jgi:hypothetical protein